MFSMKTKPLTYVGDAHGRTSSFRIRSRLELGSFRSLARKGKQSGLFSTQIGSRSQAEVWRRVRWGYISSGYSQIIGYYYIALPTSFLGGRVAVMYDGYICSCYKGGCCCFGVTFCICGGYRKEGRWRKRRGKLFSASPNCNYQSPFRDVFFLLNQKGIALH